jgi:hypothetical protein
LVAVLVGVIVGVRLGIRKTWMALTWEVSPAVRLPELKSMSNWPVVTTTVVGTS